MMAKNHGVESSGEGRGKIVSDLSSPFDSFPEDCISKIVSFTSPRDACVAATVSKAFEYAAKSDVVWEKFLPLEYASLVPSSRHFSSKKELYFALCDEPVLIDDGTKSFWLEKASGKRCIMLSAMNISIIWGDTPQYWQWITIPEARFKSVAKLRHVCWFEIRGRVKTRVLSPITRYSAYLVFKKTDSCYGFDDVAVEAGVGVVGHEASTRTICFEMDVDNERDMSWIYPEEREDGWMEVGLGEFFNGEELMNGEEIEMSVLETRDLGWKRGLIIQGIEIRPAKIQ
ncbi:putative F-box protein PP2-B6 [Hirschfeldia incana]|nr:putative F-box protein PP2-B6 [Hirschfeldia incana]